MNELLVANENGIAALTLNRPDKRNALNGGIVNSLKKALRDADADDTIRVAVLKGAGADFCSGADLSAIQKISENSVVENLGDAESLAELFLLIRKVRIPVIAAVHGRALAGGCGLATACDIVLASRSARLGYPEVKIGFVPAMVMAILRRNVSEKKAFELITRGGELSAGEAERVGLVNQVFDDEGFGRSVDEYASAYARLSKSAVMLSKKLLYQTDSMSFEAALQTGAELNAIARMTDDCREGIARFLNKK